MGSPKLLFATFKSGDIASQLSKYFLSCKAENVVKPDDYKTLVVVRQLGTRLIREKRQAKVGHAPRAVCRNTDFKLIVLVVTSVGTKHII